MAAPSFIAAYGPASNWTSATGTVTRTTSSFSVQTNDRLVVHAVSEDQSNDVTNVAGGSLTWTLQTENTTTSKCRVKTWTATAGSNTSMDVSVEKPGSTASFGFLVEHWRGSDGFGNAANGVGTGASSASLTTAAANSAISMSIGDWGAQSGASRVYRTINSITPTSANGGEPTGGYYLDASAYTVYVAHWTDAGAAGAKTVGMTTPSGGSVSWKLSAIEIKGTTSGTPVTVNVTNTSLGITASVGDESVNYGTSLTLTGNSASALVNSVVVGVMVTGNSMTASVGTVTVNITASSPPIFRSEAHTNYASGSTVITKPTGTTENDILLAGIFYVRSGLPTVAGAPPDGTWTQIGTATNVFDVGSVYGSFAVYWKRAGTSEPSSYTFTHDISTINAQGMMLAYSSAEPSGSPIDTFSQTSANAPQSGTTATYTGLTTSVGNTKVILLSHNWDGTGMSPPTGMAERLDYSGSPPLILTYAADETQAAIVTVGDKTQTLPSMNPFSAFLIALKPAFSTGAVTTYPTGMFVTASTSDVTVNFANSTTMTNTGLLSTASVGSVTVNADIRIPSLVPLNPTAFLPFLVR